MQSAHSSTADQVPRGLVIAAPGTGSGKTTITLGLLRAFRNQGVPVAPYKIGPDYIDPKYHEAASGRPCYNLDGWAMRRELLAHLVASADGAELCVAEGVMGLFDGGLTTGENGNGSTADIASLTGWPVILVINCAGIGQSVGAILRGFAGYRSDIPIVGTILNKVASPRHEAVLKDGLANCSVPVLGAIPNDSALALPSRHLGLVQAGEHHDLEHTIQAAADHIGSHCDLHRIAGLATPTDLPNTPPGRGLPPLGQRIAVARDTAFGFSYNHIFESWRRQGAELSFFSPLANQPPTPDADAVYLPGGYPELHGATLAAAANFQDGLRRHADFGKVIFGECGGYMVLGTGIEDADGGTHEMAGLLPLETTFKRRRLHLGYRRLTCGKDFAGLSTSSSYSAHEFHYATITSEGSAMPLFTQADTKEPAGLRVGQTAGSFMHLIDEIA